MLSQSQIYDKNNPRFTACVVNYGLTQMENNFSTRLKEKLDEAGFKAAELARRSGVTKQNISRLLNNTPHPITNALPTTERDTVEKLAGALDWDLNDALLSAGFAPADQNSESYDILGVANITFFNDKLSKSQQERILDVLLTVAQGVLAESEEENQIKKKTEPQRVENDPELAKRKGYFPSGKKYAPK